MYWLDGNRCSRIRRSRRQRSQARGDPRARRSSGRRVLAQEYRRRSADAAPSARRVRTSAGTGVSETAPRTPAGHRTTEWRAPTSLTALDKVMPFTTRSSRSREQVDVVQPQTAVRQIGDARRGGRTPAAARRLGDGTRIDWPRTWTITARATSSSWPGRFATTCGLATRQCMSSACSCPRRSMRSKGIWYMTSSPEMNGGRV